MLAVVSALIRPPVLHQVLPKCGKIVPVIRSCFRPQMKPLFTRKSTKDQTVSTNLLNFAGGLTEALSVMNACTETGKHYGVGDALELGANVTFHPDQYLGKL